MILGVTGRVGSGKSTAQSILMSIKEWWLADLDMIGHELLKNQFIKDQLVHLFGNILLKKESIDRKELGQLVFNNRENLRKLNHLMHPKIKQKVLDLISANGNQDGLICGALLEEIGLTPYCDKILVIDAIDNDIIGQIGNKFYSISKYQKTKQQYIKAADMVVNNKFNGNLKSDIITCFEKNGLKL